MEERINAFLTLYVEVTRNKTNTADPERRITPSELYTATTDLIRVVSPCALARSLAHKSLIVVL